MLESSLKTSLKIAQDPLTPQPSAQTNEEQHPFAHSTAKLELLPSSTDTTAHGIDLAEEARLYAELMEGNEDGFYEDFTDDVSTIIVNHCEIKLETEPSFSLLEIIRRLEKHAPELRLHLVPSFRGSLKLLLPLRN